MRLHTLAIIFMVFITITEEGRVDENTLDSRQEAVLQGNISGEGKIDRPSDETEKYDLVNSQENSKIVNQGKSLFMNNNMDFETKKKYFIHHRGNRKYLADDYGEEYSDYSDNNIDGEKADVYGKVDESSNKYLDSEKLFNDGKENMNTENYDNDHRGKTFENEKSIYNNINKEIFDAYNPGENTSNNDYVEDYFSQSLNNEEETESIFEKSDEFENDNNMDKDDDESYISPDIESFWDAVDTFINMNQYSKNHEKEDSEDPEDLYDYLYTPSGNSPGIDNFLDLLHFVKDVGDAVERIEKDIKWTSEKDPDISSLDHSNNHEVNKMDHSNNHEVDKMMAKKEDKYMSHEGHRIDKNAEQNNISSSNRRKRSNEKESEIKTYQHKPFKTSLGIKFPLFRFDFFFSKFIFEPFDEPYPDN